MVELRFGHQLNANWMLAGGYKKNVQAVDPVNSDFRIAAGEVRSHGFEINVAGELTPEWQVINSYAYVDAGFTRDNSLSKYKRLANIPRNSFNLLSVYELHNGFWCGLGLGVNLKYVVNVPVKQPYRPSPWTITP